MTLLRIRDDILLALTGDDILLALTAQQAKRAQCVGLEWIKAEREMVLQATNVWRSRLGQPSMEVELTAKELVAAVTFTALVRAAV